MENIEMLQEEALEQVDALETESNLDVEKAWALFFADKATNFVVVQISPASRVALGDYFGLSRAEDGIGKVTAVLRELGADAVVDTAIAEDAVAILETRKLCARKSVGNGLTTPLFASRCASFVAWAKENYPDICVSELPATARIFGALLKKFYGEKTGKRVRVIAVEPCRINKNLGGVDLVLTTEELVAILAETEINLRISKKDALDTPFGVCSGSGYICAMSGGVSDSIARCLSMDTSQEALRKFAYSGLYGDKKVREATIQIDNQTWKFAVVCGLAAAQELMDKIEKGEATYDYVEVMACDGGCVSGDGQACVIQENQTVEYAAKLRAQGLKYLEAKRAAKAADMSASATMLARAWTDLERRGDWQGVPIDWNELFAEVAESLSNELSLDTECVDGEADVALNAVNTVNADEPMAENVGEDVSSAEEIVEEAVEETVEEVLEDVVEEIVEANVEEVVEDVVKEIVKDEIFEEVKEEVAEIAEEVAIAEDVEVLDVVEDAEMEVIEEAIADETEEITEETEATEEMEEMEVVAMEEVEEIFEDKKDPYYMRLSGRDRRKLKRKKKGNK